jgi:hypothetical protein
LKSILIEFENRELYDQLFLNIEKDLTISNVLNRLEFLFSANESCELEIEFCSSHFSEFESKDLFSLSFEIISSIISKPSIQLQDEESLFELISNRYKTDSRFFSLFEFVQFECLSGQSIQSFIELMTKSFDLFTFSIWCSLSRCLSNDQLICSVGETSNLDGIISTLTKRFGENAVSISASGEGYPASNSLRQVIDFENQCHFYTKNEANSWICYDFETRRIKVTAYSIRSRCDGNWTQLRFWVLEGSNDGVNWVGIDDRKNDSSLKSAGAVVTFKVEEEFQKEFQKIRIRQTGKNSGNNDHIVVSGIEFFGVLKGVKS